MIDCTVLILTYKGKYHLEHLLPSIKEAIAFSPLFNIEVLIVDNGKDEETRKYVLEKFPDYRFEFSPVNDYLFSLNPFIAKMDSEFVLILNDDMKVDSNVLNTLIPIIKKDKSIFSVMAKIMDWDGKDELSGIRTIKYSLGWANAVWIKKNDNKICNTLYCGGGAGIFRTNYINELNGFDDFYRPAYCEDLDLGHRAWHKGWGSLFNPNAIIYHREGATIQKQFRSDKLTQQIYKNQILWMVGNCDKKGFLIQFLILLPYRVLTKWSVSKNSYFALIKVIPLLPKAIIKRIRRGKSTLSDNIIIEKINQ